MQLASYHAADLHLCFPIGKKQVFSRCGSIKRQSAGEDEMCSIFIRPVYHAQEYRNDPNFSDNTLEQALQTQIRLLIRVQQSDLVLYCLLFSLYTNVVLLFCKIFRVFMANF